MYSLATPKDVAAMKDFAGGGVSLLEDSLFLKAVEPGVAQQVADAAGG